MDDRRLTDAANIKAATTYNAAADHFDDVPLAFWARTGEKTVERLILRPGANVLDVGCGTGASALPAAERVGPEGSVVAVDLADGLLQLGRAKAARRGLQNIDFRAGDMADLGFPDGRFDAVVSVFSIFFVPDMERQVRELWRVVRPGGQLAITTWGPRIFEPAYTVWRQAVKKERPDLLTAFNPWDRISDPDSVRRLLQDGGVRDGEVLSESGSQELRSAEDWWTIVMGSGLRWTVDQMGRDAAQRVQSANLRWLRDNNISSVETNVIYAVATKAES